MKRGRRQFLHLAAGAAALPALPRTGQAQAFSDLMCRIAGSWTLADESLTFPDGRTIKSWGDNPFGYLSFDPAGYFSMILIRSDLPKFDTRGGGTPEQNDSVAKGMIAYYGSYAPGEDGTSVEVRIVGSTYAAFNGTVSRRPLEFHGPDEFAMHVLVSNSSVKTRLIWRRVGK
jgi:hypothetical protein